MRPTHQHIGFPVLFTSFPIIHLISSHIRRSRRRTQSHCTVETVLFFIIRRLPSVMVCKLIIIKVGCKLEVFQELHFYIRVHEIFVLLVVTIRVTHIQQWVSCLPVFFVSFDSTIFAVIIRINTWGHLLHVQSPHIAQIIAILIGVIPPSTHSYSQEIGYSRLDVTTQIIFLYPRLDNQTWIIQVSTRNRIVSTLFRTSQADSMFLHPFRVINDIIPIRIRMRHIIRYASDIRRVRVISCFTPLIDRRLGELGRLVRVEITFVDKLHIIRIIRYLTNQLGRSLVRKLARIGHIDFSIRTTFRRNQDYPISPSVTVNGTRSGIFQDGDRSHIIWIHFIEAHLHSVHKDQWASIVHRTHTTDQDGRTFGIRLATSIHHIDTSRHT